MEPMENLTNLKLEEAKAVLNEGKQLRIIASDIITPPISQDTKMLIPVDEIIVDIDLDIVPPIYVGQYIDKNGASIGQPHTHQCPGEFKNCVIEDTL